MPLILKIVVPSRTITGQILEYEFNKIGGSIGRKPNNDFILLDPERYISSNHAIIEFNDDKYTIIDTSTNGVFINNSQAALGNGGSSLLNHGDKISIGDFQLVVSLDDEPTEVPWKMPSTLSTNVPLSPVPDNFTLEEPLPPDPIKNNSDLRDPAATLYIDVHHDLAPANINNAPKNINAFVVGDDSSNFESFSSNAFQSMHELHSDIENTENGSVEHEKPVAQVVNVKNDPEQMRPQINDGLTNDGLIETSSDEHSIRSNEEELVPPLINHSINKADVNIDKNNPGPDQVDPSSVQSLHTAPTQPLEAIEKFQTPGPIVTNNASGATAQKNTDDSQASQNVESIDSTPEAVSIPTLELASENSVASAETSIPKTDHVDNYLLNSFLQGVGIELDQLTIDDKHQLMHKIGKLTRCTTEGLMMALSSRAALKNSFRVNNTTIQPVDNNPLKHLTSLDDALIVLLSNDKSGYIPAEQAISDGFKDLSSHQRAIIHGMQATIDTIFKHFDPISTERSITILPGLNSISGSKKARIWDNYPNYCRPQTENSSNNPEQVFGEEFARLYQLEIDRLL